jgi:aspartate 1-decarboxylase
MLIAKIRRMTVKQADLNYVGSVAIDWTLPQGGRLLPGERLKVVDVTNGNWLTTYVIGGEAAVKQQDTASGCRKRRAGADGVLRWVAGPGSATSRCLGCKVVSA